MNLKNIFKPNDPLPVTLPVFTIAFAVAIFAFMVLGLYSRHLADDYCEAFRVNSSSPIQAVMERYLTGDWRSANRYSNLLFVGFSERLGRYSMQITMPFMILLWVAGLTWGMHEIRKTFNINWPLQMDIYSGALLGFFSLLQAPNLFQTIYWRSSMMTHFAPLVFGCLLFAFLLRQAGRDKVAPPVYLFMLFAAFILAGFSEPPTTTMITALPLLMLAVWYWGKPPAKQKLLGLLAWCLSGVLLGLMAMVFSPAAAAIMKDTHPGLLTVILNSFYYSILFMVDSLRTQPIPFFVSTLLPFLLIRLYTQYGTPDPSPVIRRSLPLVMFVIPLLAWLLIAAGFAPSVYGQGFPVERMRFLARTIMIVSVMLEGALLGLLLKGTLDRYHKPLLQWGTLSVFAVVSVIYPLRAAYHIYRSDLHKYRSHAEQWDRRDAQIRQAVSQGAAGLIVPQLDTMEGVQEYKENNWVNRCAADYYGLQILSAPLETP